MSFKIIKKNVPVSDPVPSPIQKAKINIIKKKKIIDYEEDITDKVETGKHNVIINVKPLDNTVSDDICEDIEELDMKLDMLSDTISEMKSGEMKSGEMKSGEMKSGEMKSSEKNSRDKLLLKKIKINELNINKVLSHTVQIEQKTFVKKIDLTCKVDEVDITVNCMQIGRKLAKENNGYQKVPKGLEHLDKSKETKDRKILFGNIEMPSDLLNKLN